MLSSIITAQNNSDLQNLALKFFEWRSITQPITGDDIPRIERPDNWRPDYSPENIKLYQKKYFEFKSSLHLISKNNFTRTDSVDYLLLRSAIERVNWELNILKLPNTHPEFYIDQTLGSVFDLLVISSSFTKLRADNLLVRFNAIPNTLDDAKINLTEPIKPFAEIAISQLEGIDEKLNQMLSSFKKSFPMLCSPELEKSVNESAAALLDYSAWLKENLPTMQENVPVGRENYIYFLKNIALVPYTPEEMLMMGRIEWQRAVSFGELESIRNKNIPQPKMFVTIEEEIEQAKIDEQAIRDFLIEHDVMSVPDWTKNYTLQPMPKYVEALADFGELDDFTSPTRLEENSVRYIPPPSDKLGYFYRTAATDPRPLIIHEGTPGHYFQLIQSWKNQNPIRRHYFDSNANEGVGFYLEEMMLQLGLFENMPRTREVIYSFMRLRALRVDVDINLALGNYSIADAGKYLASTVPMDIESASNEAAFFALTPGQAITYQIGKIQVLKLISDAKVKLGDKFNLKDYHDYMMKNGNVPIAIQRWEYLGETDEIKYLWD
jgi:uncharacterized protein (DUF885 family)